MPFLIPAPPPPAYLARKLLPKIVAPPALKTALHSGDLGDVIYSLPAVRVLKPDILYLCKESRHRDPPREEMTRGKFESISSLLRLQPYIKEVYYTETIPDGINIDFNTMRTGLRDAYDHWRTLSGWHLWQFNLSLEEDKTQWLTVDHAVKIKDRPVVVSRSSRYWNPDFDWTAVLKRYNGSMIFVGFPSEHEDFQKRFGAIDYHPTPTFLDLARVISGAELFIGNQSAPRAIAEGFKIPVIVEGCARCPNTHFERPGAAYAYQNDKIQFPAVGHTVRQKPRLVVGGAISTLDALGQLLFELCMGLIRKGVDVQVNPWLVVDRFVKPHPELMAQVAQEAKPDLTVMSKDRLLVDGALLGGEVVFTMWESTRIVPKVIEQLNRRARAVIVPSVWNAAVLDACGCNLPVRIIPLGIDPSLFSYKKSPGTRGLVSFGTAARHSHGKERKGLAMVGNAFLKAFPNEKDVRLNYKVHADCEFERVSDNRVSYIAEWLGWKQMAEWYRGNTAYISGSRGEGWGLHLHQAMAVGCCPIASRFGGQGEFFDGSVGREIKFKQVRATGDYTGEGSWAELDEQSLVDQMRWVYENQKDARKLGLAASTRAAEFTWERTSDELMLVLREFGLIE